MGPKVSFNSSRGIMFERSCLCIKVDINCSINTVWRKVGPRTIIYVISWVIPKGFVIMYDGGGNICEYSIVNMKYITKGARIKHCICGYKLWWAQVNFCVNG